MSSSSLSCVFLFDVTVSRYVLEHLSKISRVLRIPSGNALLVGVGGSGRQSITRLASFMSGIDVFQPEISKNYGRADWREDLKKLLRVAGGQNKKISFLITDSQIKEESFLEDIDALLNSGEVPNLFAADEKGELLEVRLLVFLPSFIFDLSGSPTKTIIIRSDGN